MTRSKSPRLLPSKQYFLDISFSYRHTYYLRQIAKHGILAFGFQSRFKKKSYKCITSRRTFVNSQTLSLASSVDLKLKQNILRYSGPIITSWCSIQLANFDYVYTMQNIYFSFFTNSFSTFLSMLNTTVSHIQLTVLPVH